MWLEVPVMEGLELAVSQLWEGGGERQQRESELPLQAELQ